MKRRYAEIVLLAGGACLLLKGSWDLANYAGFQSHPEWYVGAAKTAKSDQADARTLPPIAFRSSNYLPGIADLQVLGKVEVPRLGMSVLVVEGDEERKLALAAGHLSHSAGLGQKGNSVIAGHRDTSFWPLRKIKIGDRIRVRAGKTYEYVVSSVRIVNPEDVSVLGSTDNRTLTLVTCYPFRYLGSAPKRFIVQAAIPRS